MATYYIDFIGNNANDGLSPGAAFRTSAKLDSVTLQPNDVVLFKRGGTYGPLNVNQQGLSNKPIIYSSYGTGAKPLLSGFTLCTGWTNSGTNIYYTTLSSAGSALNMVTINGVNTPMGRFPKASAQWGGYLPIDSCTSTTVTSSSLAGKNFTGGEFVSRVQHWQIDRTKITSHSGSQITLTSAGEQRALWGYFIQNHLSTLTQDNDWYFDSSTKRLYVYASGDINNKIIYAATASNIINAYGMNFTQFNGLAIQGGNSGINIGNTTKGTIQNCDISFCGINGVLAVSTAQLTIQNSSFTEINDTGVWAQYPAIQPLMTDNSFYRIGYLRGMHQTGPGTSQASTMLDCSDGIITGNILRDIGNNGLVFYGSGMFIEKNDIENTNMIKDDGSGIYFQSYNGSSPVASINIINNNIVRNVLTDRLLGIGPDALYYAGEGIYMDDAQNNFHITNNIIENCIDSGVYCHSTNNGVVTGNIIHNCGVQQMLFRHDSISTNPIRNMQFTNNTLVAKTGQKVLALESDVNDILQFGTFNNNNYVKPSDESVIVSTIYTSPSRNEGYYSLAQWKTLSNKDSASVGTPNGTSTSVETLLAINKDPAVSVNLNLSGVYKNLSGTVLSGFIQQNSFTATPLLKTASLIPATTGITRKSITITSTPN